MYNIIILAIVQGLTEFLPISSSGHLVLFHHFLDQNNAVGYSKVIDISVHFGTFLAVLFYFWKDVKHIVRGGLDILCLRPKTANAQQALILMVASAPVVIAGFFLFQFQPSLFDSLVIVAWMTLIFGGVLYIADRRPQGGTTVEDFTLKHALLYGLAQCIALVPGVSRSGITMTAGRFMGHNRTEAARCSLLMGMVAIAGAGTLAGLSMVGDIAITNDFLMVLGVGIAVSFATAYGAILLMMRWVSHASFTPFVIYRVILGLVLLGLLYSGAIPQDVEG